jgi:hypothetical protein
MIWLSEVAARQPQHRSIHEQLRAGNEADNPGNEAPGHRSLPALSRQRS